jgi:hypothetical protein
MADLDPPCKDGASVNSAQDAANPESHTSDDARGNHTSPKPGEPAPQATGNAPDDRSGLDRAEEVVDHLAERVSSLTSSWGRKLLRLSSRARESAQDFWAEVQDFRQGKKP